MRNNNFTPTFRKYADMTDGEKAAFRQGATTVDNGGTERLGLKPPRTPPPAQPPKAAAPAPLGNKDAPKGDIYARYMQVKRKHGNALLFYRLGDFYEVFGDDAKTVSKALDITLTTRQTADGRIPMCGVPFHTLDRYLAELTRRGYKVAVAESV